LYKLGNSLSD